MLFQIAELLGEYEVITTAEQEWLLRAGRAWSEDDEH
jgi:hypothetical protein